MISKQRSRRSYFAAATVGLLFVAACGSDSDEGESGAEPAPDATAEPTVTTDEETVTTDEETVTTDEETADGGTTSVSEDAAPAGEIEDPEITIGNLPIADYAAVIWADENGFFEEEGLSVELEILQGGPVGIQRVVANDLDFSFTNLISFSIAVSGGAPIQVAALTSSLGDQAGGIYVNPDSDIETLADLDGRTLGVNTTANVGDVTINALLAEEGIDATPSYVEVPFPEMVAGVQAGSIDAGYTTEPFTALAELAGLRNLVNLYSGVNEALPMAIFATSDEYYQENPNTVAAFTRAVNAASAEINEDTDAFREFLPGATSTDPAVAEAISLPVFEEELDLVKIQRTADLVFEQGLIPERLDMQAYVVD